MTEQSTRHETTEPDTLEELLEMDTRTMADLMAKRSAHHESCVAIRRYRQSLQGVTVPDALAAASVRQAIELLGHAASDLDERCSELEEAMDELSIGDGHPTDHTDAQGNPVCPCGAPVHVHGAICPGCEDHGTAQRLAARRRIREGRELEHDDQTAK